MSTATVTKPYLLDVNVLIALAWPQHVHHIRSHAWFDVLKEEWATTPITEAGYLHVTMSAAVVGSSIRASEAIASHSSIRALPRHKFLADNSSFARFVIH
ncbi:MAG TPA: hypothetical protein VIJ18_14375 [Microbacteriaceae bacterium]